MAGPAAGTAAGPPAAAAANGTQPASRDAPRWRPRLLAATGIGAVLGVTAYNAATHSGLSPPEWALLTDGLALAAAAPALEARVGRIPVATAVAWSFPLLLAPLALFALNAITSDAQAGTAAAPIVAAAVVEPTAWALRVLGMPIAVAGSSMMVATPRGSLTLGVGLVCAGLYPMTLFGGLVAFHAWRTNLPARRLAVLLAAGLAGLWVMNVLRLTILTHVGVAQGPRALQQWHAHLGWILFLAFTVVFWGLATRRRACPSPAADAAPAPASSPPR